MCTWLLAKETGGDQMTGMIPHL